MAKRKKRFRGNHSSGDPAADKKDTAEPDHQPSAQPPQPNRTLLAVSLALMVGWLVFLAVVALSR